MIDQAYKKGDVADNLWQCFDLKRWYRVRTFPEILPTLINYFCRLCTHEGLPEVPELFQQAPRIALNSWMDACKKNDPKAIQKRFNRECWTHASLRLWDKEVNTVKLLLSSYGSCQRNSNANERNVGVLQKLKKRGLSDDQAIWDALTVSTWGHEARMNS